jgi:hypothetical protein
MTFLDPNVRELGPQSAVYIGSATFQHKEATCKSSKRMDAAGRSD